jgi:predicted hotdog family 3-hydroxylacyl-ACP dehydratase
MNTGLPLTVAAVLPHEGRMLLLDELLDYGPEHVECGVNIHAGSMFCDGTQGVPVWVGLEYMAQTACAFSGVEEVRAGLEPSIGLLLGTRSFRPEGEWFPLGARLRIRADLLMRDENNLVAFACTIHDGDRLVARGDVKALRPDDVRELLGGRR